MRMQQLMRVLILAVSGIVPTSHAEVTIEARSNPHWVTAAHYKMLVDWDGCLTRIEMGDIQFLAPGISISRGGYFFQGAALRLEHVAVQGDAVEANSAAASIRYEFNDRGVDCTMENRTHDTMVFFFVLTDRLQAVWAAEDEISTGPLVQETDRLGCYARGKVVEFEQITRVWGPWEGNHQVVQIDLPPHTPKEVLIRVRDATSSEREQINAMSTPTQMPDLIIQSPRLYQVIQRDTAEQGEVLVSGRCQPVADAVELQFGGVTMPETETVYRVPLQSKARYFSARVTLPAGGWYRLDARAIQGKEGIAEASVSHFGIGEVFVGGGQSNSTNCGEFKTQQTSGMVSSFGGTRWQLADDPQLGVADNSQGGSFWPAFGDAMFAKHQVPIGVATTGFGGTSVDQWQPDGELYAWMMTRIHQLGPAGFRALLWHQGESDVGKSQDEYYQKLKRVIWQSQHDAGWAFPWFVAQTSYHNVEMTRDAAIRDAQQQIWTDGLALPGPDTDTLTGDHRDMGGEGVHFSPKGLGAHGRMWAESVSPYLDEVLAGQGTP